MNSTELRQKFLDFFESKGHKVVPSSSLVPEGDSTTLFTGSGMQPLVQYLLGEKHPDGNRIVNSQKSFRAEDIEEVGDNRHTTFFEMLGNWSLGDYFKKEQLTWFFEFITEEVKLDPSRIYVTVFAGDEKNDLPKDTVSPEIWKELFKSKGIDAKEALLGSLENASEVGMQGGRIFYYGSEKNWWSRWGSPERMPIGEPGGPDSEIFYDFGTPHNTAFGKECHPNCDCGRFVEIGNSVFMEYKKGENGFEILEKKNVDFGGGFERVLAASNNDPDIFKIDVLYPIIQKIEELSLKKYGGNDEDTKAFRIIADHIRAAVFLIKDGVTPSNTGQGYVLRRLIRRARYYFNYLGASQEALHGLTISIVRIYKESEYELDKNEALIDNVLKLEETKFMSALELGKKHFEKGKDPFILYTTYGFPFELALEMAKEKGIEIDEADFKTKMEEHQKLSQTASAGMFKGGLADHEPKTVKLHTAHHLLLAALQEVLGKSVKQRGSNITQDRLRIDFAFDRKMTDEEKQKVEEIVNDKIKNDMQVVRKEMPKDEAEQLGAEMEFGAKYGSTVSVYLIEDKEGNVYSKEFCGGPHISHTGELGKFKILKEEASSQGVRRIKAALE